jgi:Diaminopimelate epimerase
MTALPFLKMHGLGNDFVVIDARRQAVALDEAQTRRIADRRQGIGCDQLILIEPAKNRLADAFMRIRNSDGGEVEACGNATRCVADLLMKENGSRHVVIETMVGLLDAEAGGQRADQRRYGAGAPRLARDPAGQGHGYAPPRCVPGRAQGSGGGQYRQSPCGVLRR